MTQRSNRRGGAASTPWLALMVCAGVGLAGLGLELGAPAGERFWFGEQTGAFAMLGAGCALFAALAARAARLVLGRAMTEAEMSADADDHA